MVFIQQNVVSNSTTISSPAVIKTPAGAPIESVPTPVSQIAVPVSNSSDSLSERPDQLLNKMMSAFNNKFE